MKYVIRNVRTGKFATMMSGCCKGVDFWTTSLENAEQFTASQVRSEKRHQETFHPRSQFEVVPVKLVITRAWSR